DGEEGRAAAFLESDSLVTVPRTPFIQVYENMRRFAVRVKIKVPSKPSATTSCYLVHKYLNGVGWVFGLLFDEDGMRLWGTVKAPTDSYSESTTKISYGEWHELAFSYDDFGDRKTHIWADGVEVIYDTHDASSGDLYSDANAELVIGNLSATTDRCLYGYIERLMLYRRTLVTSELSGGELLCKSRGCMPVLSPSGGNWDRTTLRDPILLMNENGEIEKVNGQYVVYYTGGSAYPDYRIGRAVSDDGVHWTKSPSGAPVLDVGETGSWDEKYVGMGTVIKMNPTDGGTHYRLYYTGRDNAGNFGLGLATSSDGVSFTKHSGNPLISGDQWDTNTDALAVAYVIQLTTGQWALMFESNSPFKIYLGLSDDGIAWTPSNDGDPVMEGTAEEWDSNGVANPKLFELAPGKYLLGFNGQAGNAEWNIGFAYSTDLINWTKFSGNPVMVRGPAEWELARIENAFIAKQDVGTDTVRMWYFGGPDSTFFRIGYATCPQSGMDIFDMIDVTGWQKHVEPNLCEGRSVQLCESGGAAKQFHQAKTLTAEDYVVSFLAYTDGSEITSADLAPFADTALSNEISQFHYEHQGGGIYLCWGTFTATAADWNVGVEVKANKRAYISLLTCLKGGTSKASGPYPRSPVANSTTAPKARQADSLTVGGSSNFDGNKGTLDIELYPMFPSNLANDFEFCCAHFYGGAGEVRLFRDTPDEIKFRVQGNGDDETVTGTVSWNRGDRVKIRVVWNCQQTLDGTNYMLIFARVNGGDWTQIGECPSQPTAPSSDQTLYVGRRGDSAGYEANSFISWLRIYDRALLNPSW
ncbi:hypothetical protein HQ563_15985, partial [bacterium]|nr:hypothetical protein [bacterium]